MSSKSGSRFAGELVASSYGAAIIRFVVSLGVSPADASDVLQETLVAAWRGWDSFSGTGSRRAWVFGIARRQALLALRSQRRHARRGEAAGVDAEVEAGQAFEARLVDRSALQEATAQLPMEQRETVVLAFVVGMPLAEIAEVQGVPVGTVKSRLNTARNRLRTALREAYPERGGGHASGLAARTPRAAT